jgi:hypothetical protein
MTHLFGRVLTQITRIHQPQKIIGPKRPAFRNPPSQPGEALEHARPQRKPQGSGPPPAHPGYIDAQMSAVLLLRRGTGVGVYRHLQVLASGPDLVVATVVIGRVADPARWDQDPAPQSGLCRSSDLGYRRIDIRQYRHDRDAGPPLGAVATQLGQPTVVGPRPGHCAPRVEIAQLAQAGPKRGPGDPGHGVGVGEDHLADHPVTVELFVPQSYIPSAGDAVSVLGEPLLGELLVDESADLRRGSLLGQVGLAGWTECMGWLREGDRLVVVAVDRSREAITGRARLVPNYIYAAKPLCRAVSQVVRVPLAPPTRNPP